MLLLSSVVSAQYAPPAGQSGTSAMHMDSSSFVGWAISCDAQLGPQDISNSSLGNASVGTEESTKGIATGLSVLSLGDGGTAVLQFSSPISNGLGPDFAVFENSFSDDFLELAFVEVSSDGVNYVRFPASSLTQTGTQVGTFGTIDATKINNLAGKYIGKYGTPFDLEELDGESGLNVNKVTHVKIIDVIGSIDPQYASYDTAGNVVNDPWSTAYSSSGFDLDGVGVINNVSNKVRQLDDLEEIVLFPNPTRNYFSISHEGYIRKVRVFDMFGGLVLESLSGSNINTSTMNAGIYIVEVVTSRKSYIQKITIVNE